MSCVYLCIVVYRQAQISSTAVFFEQVVLGHKGYRCVHVLSAVGKGHMHLPTSDNLLQVEDFEIDMEVDTEKLEVFGTIITEVKMEGRVPASSHLVYDCSHGEWLLAQMAYDRKIRLFSSRWLPRSPHYTCIDVLGCRHVGVALSRFGSSGAILSYSNIFFVHFWYFFYYYGQFAWFLGATEKRRTNRSVCSSFLVFLVVPFDFAPPSILNPRPACPNEAFELLCRTTLNDACLLIPLACHRSVRQLLSISSSLPDNSR